MRTRILMTSFFVLVGTTLAIAQGQSGDEQAIRKANDAFADAFNKGNLDGLTGMWTSDAEYVNDEGKTTKGRDKIGLLFKEQLAVLKGHTLKLKTLAIHVIKPDVALEDGIAEVAAPDGQAETSRYISVWTKSDGKWLLARSQDLPGEVEPAAAESNYKRLKELEWLIGDWSFENKEKETAVMLACRWIKNKNFIQKDYSIKLKGEEAMSVTVILGWDPTIGQIKSWFFDSKGGHGEGLWAREGRKWISQTTGVVSDGRVGSSVNSLEMVDDNTFVWRSQDREIGGNVMPDAEVKFTRKTASP